MKKRPRRDLAQSILNIFYGLIPREHPQYLALRDQLDNTLKYLYREGVDIAGVLEDLRWGQGEQIRAKIIGYGIDKTRIWEEERRFLCDQVPRLLTRVLEFFEYTGYANPENWSSGEVPSVVQTFARARAAFDPEAAANPLIWALLPEDHTGRRGEGRPRLPWKDALFRRLRARGISQDDIGDLLTAIGLRRYTPRRSR